MSARYIPKKIKLAVIARSLGRCEYCQSWARNAIHTFPIDHIIPLDKGGLTVLENLANTCGGCNGFKLDKIKAIDPITKKEVPLFNPRTQKWKDHFAWSNDYLEMIGLTPTGRATIILLRLNRTGLRNIRRLTKATNEHPPID